MPMAGSQANGFGGVQDMATWASMKARIIQIKTTVIAAE